MLSLAVLCKMNVCDPVRFSVNIVISRSFVPVLTISGVFTLYYPTTGGLLGQTIVTITHLWRFIEIIEKQMICERTRTIYQVFFLTNYVGNYAIQVTMFKKSSDDIDEKKCISCEGSPSAFDFQFINYG